MDKNTIASLRTIAKGLSKPSSRLGNCLSVLKCAAPQSAWIGIYIFDRKRQCLCLGPFQGTPACEIIQPTKGVVGVCYTQKDEIYVPDVSLFPTYIACDENSKSELCLPLAKNGEVVGVFDIDYPTIDGLADDKKFYEQAKEIVEGLI